MIKKEYDFSIITPVFNGEKYIEETILSVLECGKNHSFEYIVVDDGSTDQTASIVKKYESSLRYVFQENAGESNAVNRGFLEARGTFVLVVNDDDPMLTGDLLTESSKAFLGDAEVVVTYPDWQIIDTNGKVIVKKVTPEFSLENLVGKFICLPGPGAVFRRSQMLSVGGRDTNLKFLSDYEFWLRMSHLGSFKRIPKVLAQWREHPGSTSTASRGLPMALERIQVIENFVQLNGITGLLQRQALSHAYYRAAVLRYFSADVPGRRWLIKSLWLRKGWVEELKIRQAIYLLGTPMTEKLWHLVKSLTKV
jgi:glycosyltransferase involved in cell wall biosynthesis